MWVRLDVDVSSRVLLSRRPTPTSGDQPASSDDPESATPDVAPHPSAAQKFLQPRPRADTSSYPPRKRGRPSSDHAVLLGPIGSPTSSRRDAPASGGGRIRFVAVASAPNARATCCLLTTHAVRCGRVVARPSARLCDWCRARHHNSPIAGMSLCRECGKAWKISLNVKEAARRRHQAPNGAVGAVGSAAGGPVPSPLSQRPVAWSPSDSPAEGSDTDVAAAAAGGISSSKRRRHEPVAAPATDAVDDEPAAAAIAAAAAAAAAPSAAPWVQGSHLYDLPSRLMAALFPTQQHHVAE